MTKTQHSLLNTPLRSPVTFLGAPRNPVPDQEIPPLPTSRVSLGSQRLGVKTTPLGRSPLLATPAQLREKQPLQRVDLQKQSVGLQTLSVNPLALSATPMPTPKLKPLEPSSSKPMAKLDSPSLFSPKLTAKLGSMKLSSPRVSRETTAKSKQNTSDRSQASATQGMSVAYLEHHSQTRDKAQSRSVAQEMSSTYSTSCSQMKDKRQLAAQDAPIAHLQPSGPSMPLVSERRLPLLGQRVELHPIAAVQHPVARRKSRKCK